MCGQELIDYIKEHHLEDKTFYGNFADDHPCVLEINEYCFRVDGNMVTIDSY